VVDVYLILVDFLQDVSGLLLDSLQDLGGCLFWIWVDFYRTLIDFCLICCRIVVGVCWIWVDFFTGCWWVFA